MLYDNNGVSIVIEDCDLEPSTLRGVAYEPSRGQVIAPEQVYSMIGAYRIF